MVVPVIHMPQRIDSDNADNDATNEIRLRRVAHTPRLAARECKEAPDQPGPLGLIRCLYPKDVDVGAGPIGRPP